MRPTSSFSYARETIFFWVDFDILVVVFSGFYLFFVHVMVLSAFGGGGVILSFVVSRDDIGTCKTLAIYYNIQTMIL